MKQLKNTIVTLCALFALSGAANAGTWGLGVTGSMAAIGGTGTEGDGSNNKGTETDGSNRKGSASHVTPIGSIFAEYTMDALNGLTVGFDYIPGKADVNANDLTRTSTDQGSGTSGSTSGATKRTANAEISNHMTLYAELPVGSLGTFVKLGYAEVDLKTTDSSDNTNAGLYGNKTMSGILYGLGWKANMDSGMYYKLQGSYTDYDSISLTSTSGNTVTGELDVMQVGLAIGYAF